MRRAQSQVMWIIVGTMVALAVAALLIVIVRPTAIGFGERSNQTSFNVLENIKDAIPVASGGSGGSGGTSSGQSCASGRGTCTSADNCASGNEIRGSCPGSKICCTQ